MPTPNGLRVVLFSALLLSACGGAKKRAGDYMEKGLFDDAIRTYDEVLKKDPNDTDAAAGLRSARVAWTDQRLIDVRRARLAGSSDHALDLLLEAVNRESQWGSLPGGKVGFTQSEEILYGMAHAEKVTADSVARKLPLRAEYFLLKYRKLFEGGEVARRFENARAHTKAAGKASCLTFQPATGPSAGAKKKKGPDPAAELAVKHPYYYAFVRLYCDYWGEVTPEPPEAAGKYRLAYFDKIQVNAAGVANLPPDVRVLIADASRAAFQRSAWFDSKGEQGIELVVGGGYSFNETRVPQRLQHVYTEKVPYTEYVQVQKSRQIPTNVTEMVYDPISKLNKPHEVTRYHTEFYMESQPQTKMRDVQRVYPYLAFQRDRKLSLGLSSQVLIDKHPVQLELSETSQSGGIEHGESQPAIGLKPAQPSLEDPPAWLKTQANRFVAQFEQKLANLWRETYCQGTGNEELVAAGDTVQKCLRQKLPETPAFADAWYQKHLGVSAREAASVLGERK